MPDQPEPQDYFSERYYSRRYARYAVHKKGGWDHYKAEGEDDGFRPNPYFSAEWWKYKYGVGSGEFETAFENYVVKHSGTVPSDEYETIRQACFADDDEYNRVLGKSGRSRNGLIDFAYIQAQNTLGLKAPDPICLYLLMSGEGFEASPSPLFDVRYYLDNNADVEDQGFDPFVHFVKHGFFEGRTPSAFLSMRRDYSNENGHTFLANAYSPVELFDVKAPYEIQRGGLGEIGANASVHISSNLLMGEPAIKGCDEFEMMFAAYAAYMESQK